MIAEAACAKPRCRRIVRGLVKTAVVLFVVVLVARLIWGYAEAKRLKAEVARISVAGEPLTFKELDAGEPEGSEADDAEPYYEAAIALLRDKNTESLQDAWTEYAETVKQSPASRPSPDCREKVATLLANNALALDMLDRAAKLPACRFDIGVESGMERCLERLSRVRACARLLSARALVCASEGKGDEAVDSLIRLLQLRRVCERWPVVIVHLVEVACLSLACMDVAVVLERSQPSVSALARLHDALSAADQPWLLRRCLLAERIYCVQLMRDLLVDEHAAAPPGDRVGLGGGFWGRPWAEHLTVGVLRDYARLLKLSEGSLPDALEAMRGEGAATSVLGEIVNQPMERVFTLTARALAEVRSAGVATLVERYRRDHGRVPATLADVVPRYARAVPIDPFTGRSLLYRQDAQGYVIYGVGENRTDDGGEVVRVGKTGRPRDNGIRVRIAGR